MTTIFFSSLFLRKNEILDYFYVIGWKSCKFEWLFLFFNRLFVKQFVHSLLFDLVLFLFVLFLLLFELFFCYLRVCFFCLRGVEDKNFTPYDFVSLATCTTSILSWILGKSISKPKRAHNYQKTMPKPMVQYPWWYYLIKSHG